ncbi:MAG: type II toxin-antitoxin system death-on-curing family toxin [Magnetospirillum sp. WYHS-4]
MSCEPRWLPLDWVLAIHDEQLAMFGGGTGIRDPGLLESALAKPVNRWHYEPGATFPELAAALGHGIIANHPFVDGNKRTGLICMPIFLHINGWLFDPDKIEEVRMILGVAAGEVGEAELARWVAAASRPR